MKTEEEWVDPKEVKFDSLSTFLGIKFLKSRRLSWKETFKILFTKGKWERFELLEVKHED